MDPFFFKKYKKIIATIVVALALAGVFLRFQNITGNDFILYDEGYYLNHNRKFVKMIETHRPYDFKEFWKAFYVLLRFSLATGKALWFLFVDARVFFGGLKAWFFPRVVSACAGSISLVFIYLFAKRFYDSKFVGFLSVVFLAFLPSHIFYSRVAIQEAVSTMFFLLGFYFYLFPKRFSRRTFISSFFFVCAFFTNYRLIILPALVGFTELYMWLATKEKPGFRKYMWNTLIFFFLIFLIGNIDEAQNTVITFAWMFHQANLAKGVGFSPINLLSYPYYLFRLESIFFGLGFFANIYFVIKKEWWKAFPFVLVFLMMGIFSFAGDRGVRYLCVGMPFMIMSFSALITHLFVQKEDRRWRIGLTLFALFAFVTMSLTSFMVSRFKSDYRTATEYLVLGDKNVKIMSSQNWVQNLYVDYKHNVIPLPYGFTGLLEGYSKGYRYLVIDPQAYVSYTLSGNKFDPHLRGYLGFIVSEVKPIKTFPHFTGPLLERFVLEHNENLENSIKFLNTKDQGLGLLRIYDVRECLQAMAKRVGKSNFNKLR